MNEEYAVYIIGRKRKMKKSGARSTRDLTGGEKAPPKQGM